MNKILHKLLFFVLVAMLGSCAWQLKPQGRPNVIIILTDDQGWGDVSFNGNLILNTPFLDSLAHQSVIFNRFYVTLDDCETRVGLLTGKYLPNSQLSPPKTVVDSRQADISLAGILKNYGYKTAYFGKWNTYFSDLAFGITPDFDNYLTAAYSSADEAFAPVLNYNGSAFKTQGYVNNVLTDSMVGYIHNCAKPFFTMLAYMAPDKARQIPREYYLKYIKKGIDRKTAIIYGMCENIDDNLSRIHAELKKSGALNNTIFIYMSDNGSHLVRYNGGLKGRKAELDEGGLRVPFAISFPNGKFAKRNIKSDFGTYIDLFPTLLNLCSISTDTIVFDGVSLASILVDSLHHLPERKFYTSQRKGTSEEAMAVRTNRYLLTCYRGDTSLYDLKADPYQIIDLSTQNVALVDSFISCYNNWLSEYNERGYDEKLEVNNQLNTLN